MEEFEKESEFSADEPELNNQIEPEEETEPVLDELTEFVGQNFSESEEKEEVTEVLTSADEEEFLAAKEEINAIPCADMDLITVSPVEFVSYDNEESILCDDPKLNLDIMQDVKMHITVELGRAKSSVKKILEFSKGSIVELNKVAGEQVELFANGKFVAFGEVIVIEDKFGLRVTNVANQNIHQHI